MTSFDDQAAAWEWLRLNSPAQYEQMQAFKKSGVLEQNCLVLQAGIDQMARNIASARDSIRLKAELLNESIRRSHEEQSAQDHISRGVGKNSEP